MSQKAITAPEQYISSNFLYMLIAHQSKQSQDNIEVISINVTCLFIFDTDMLIVLSRQNIQDSSKDEQQGTIVTKREKLILL